MKSTARPREPAWLRYEHTVPPESFWRSRAAKGTPLRIEPRAELITDFYAFNTRVLRGEYGTTPSMLGLHWVGDLILDGTVDVRGDKGSLLLDLVKGGRHFRATIDVATGKAVLSIDGLPDWHPTAQTKVRGPGEHRLMFANVDRQLTLWVDDNVVEFDAPTTYDDLGNDRPRSSEGDRGDLSPVGIGSDGVALTVTHLRVLRDIYYIADRSLDRVPITDFRARTSMVPLYRPEELVEFLSTPSTWDQGRGTSAFDDRQEVDFELNADQFFVLGDNSPASSDARFWPGENYVDRSLLVGKALFVYWPHPLNLHVPGTSISIPMIPNLPDMGLIR